MQKNSVIIPESIIQETKKRKKHKRMLFALSLSSVCVVLFFWQAAVDFSWLNPKYVASPLKVIETFSQKINDIKPDGATLGVHVYTSLHLVFIGYSLAVLIGVPLGLVTGYYRVADKLITPIFEIIRPIPPIAWIPLSVVWMGIGTTAKAFIIFLAAFVPCVINSYTGIKLTNPVLMNVAKTCGASDFKVFSSVCVPSAMPMVFTGIRVAIGNAWSTLVAAELLAATAGLGYMIQQGRSLIRSDIIIVGMLTIGIIGAILLYLLGKVEDKVIGWRAQK